MIRITMERTRETYGTDGTETIMIEDTNDDYTITLDDLMGNYIEPLLRAAGYHFKHKVFCENCMEYDGSEGGV